MNRYPVNPYARTLIAKPEMTWSARKWIDQIAWRSAIAPPDRIPTSSPRTHESSLSAAMIPKKAPINIIPSSPMFTTPERSEIIPPSAPKISGVAKRSIDAKSPDRDDHGLELPDPRAGREVAEAEAEEGGGHRVPPEAPLAPGDEEDAREQREQGEEQAPHPGAGGDRRQRDERGGDVRRRFRPMRASVEGS